MREPHSPCRERLLQTGPDEPTRLLSCRRMLRTPGITSRMNVKLAQLKPAKLTSESQFWCYHRRMPELPAAYDELPRWFPQQSDRAAALGVSREMVWRWERVRDAAARPQVRARTARVIEDVVATAREAERRVGDPE